MKEFIKALVSKNKSNIVPAEHNLFGHFVGEWDFEWIDAYGTTVRMYNPDTLAWDILYTELGGATQLEARWEKDRIVQTVVNNDNLRWVFSEITQTSFHWQRLVRTDGEHWTVEAELFAVRR